MMKQLRNNSVLVELLWQSEEETPPGLGILVLFFPTCRKLQ